MRSHIIGAGILAAIVVAGAPLLAKTGFCVAPYCGTGRPDPWPNGQALTPNSALHEAYVGRYNCEPGVQPCRSGYSAELLGANDVMLANMCRAGLFGPGHDCVPTITEEVDASFAIPRGSPTACQWWFAPTWPNGTEAGAATDPTVRKDKPPGVYSDRHPQHGCTWWHVNTCGNGTKDAGEDLTTCPADAGPPPPRCGDGKVDPGETCQSCPADAGACPPPPPPPPATALMLGPNGRFRVEATSTKPSGQTGAGKARALESDTGAFWFFAPTNLELMVKVLDGCALGGHWWVFAAGLTNVAVDLAVTDTATGAVRHYTNPQGAAFAPTQDTEAFPCP